MHVYHLSRAAIELALLRIKRDGVVLPAARFNDDAERGLRKEVSHRDDDFQYRLGEVQD